MNTTRLAFGCALLVAFGGCRAVTKGEPSVSNRARAPTGAESGKARQPLAPSPETSPAQASRDQAPLPSPTGESESPFGRTPFPPPDLAPPHERSAQSGDGVWRALGGSGERVRSDGSRILVTVIHPHEVSKWQKLTVAVLDQSRLRVHYVVGQSDLEDIAKLTNTNSEGVAAGLVPKERLDELLVVFNGGFKPRHGRWGMKSSGRILLEPKSEGCAVAVDRTSTVTIRDWDSIRARMEELPDFRQTPPCLVERGQLHEKLEAFNERPWAGFDPKRKTRRRSALGIDRSGRWLFYAIGEEMGPRVLAQGMRLVGAEFAAELDINWSWTRFLLYSDVEGRSEPEVTSTLIPEMVHRRGQYVAKPAARGFFYVTPR